METSTYRIHRPTRARQLRNFAAAVAATAEQMRSYNRLAAAARDLPRMEDEAERLDRAAREMEREIGHITAQALDAGFSQDDLDTMIDAL